MKKNLLSLLILVLLIVNIAMTAVMMISVTGTNKKTAELITSIATALNLELYTPSGKPVADVPLSETEAYDDIPALMIPLSPSIVVNPDGTTTTSSKVSYFGFKLTLMQNTKHKDYKKMGGKENLDGRVSLVTDAVNKVVGAHTLEECQTPEGRESISEEILAEIQRLFGSDFIYKIGLSDLKYGG